MSAIDPSRHPPSNPNLTPQEPDAMGIYAAEEELGRAMLALAQSEGHRPKLPPSPSGGREPQSVEKYEILAKMHAKGLTPRQISNLTDTPYRTVLHAIGVVKGYGAEA